MTIIICKCQENKYIYLNAEQLKSLGIELSEEGLFYQNCKEQEGGYSSTFGNDQTVEGSYKDRMLYCGEVKYTYAYGYFTRTPMIWNNTSTLYLYYISDNCLKVKETQETKYYYKRNEEKSNRNTEWYLERAQ